MAIIDRISRRTLLKIPPAIFLACAQPNNENAATKGSLISRSVQEISLDPETFFQFPSGRVINFAEGLRLQFTPDLVNYFIHEDYLGFEIPDVIINIIFIDENFGIAKSRHFLDQYSKLSNGNKPPVHIYIDTFPVFQGLSSNPPANITREAFYKQLSEVLSIAWFNKMNEELRNFLKLPIANQSIEKDTERLLKNTLPFKVVSLKNI